MNLSKSLISREFVFILIKWKNMNFSTCYLYPSLFLGRECLMGYSGSLEGALTGIFGQVGQWFSVRIWLYSAVWALSWVPGFEQATQIVLEVFRFICDGAYGFPVLYSKCQGTLWSQSSKWDYYMQSMHLNFCAISPSPLCPSKESSKSCFDGNDNSYYTIWLRCDSRN